MTRNSRATEISARPTVDAFTAEVIRNSAVAITDEMKTNLMRTAYNMIIYEAEDFTVGLFDADGDTISIGLGLPKFIRGLSDAIKAKIAYWGKENIEPGDILLTNDPQVMGSHLNHMIFTLPVFHEGELVAFASSMGHWQDVGVLRKQNCVQVVQAVQIVQSVGSIGESHDKKNNPPAISARNSNRCHIFLLCYSARSCAGGENQNQNILSHRFDLLHPALRRAAVEDIRGKRLGSGKHSDALAGGQRGVGKRRYSLCRRRRSQLGSRNAERSSVESRLVRLRSVDLLAQKSLLKKSPMRASPERWRRSWATKSIEKSRVALPAKSDYHRQSLADWCLPRTTKQPDVSAGMTF